uniref:Uncharacterized protein n=1 Tax=Kalanchoe fedtschenkoi TaxID=63787 RepID=A0A7N0UPL6_KALFE
MWFRATESPTNATFLFRIIRRNNLGLNPGRLHPSGFQLQFKKSRSSLPFKMQFFEVDIVGQVQFVYAEPRIQIIPVKSGI